MPQATSATSPSSSQSTAHVVEGLREVFQSGVTRSVAWRQRQLRAIERLCKERETEITNALEKDLGRPAIDSYASEVGFVLTEASHARKHLRSWMTPQKVPTPITLQPAKSSVRSQPLGTVLIISPWNYPFQLLLGPLIAALAAGNTVLLKPSEIAPATAELIERLVPEYFPDGAVQVMCGGIPETTAILKERFDHIFYTGNGTVARIVMRAAAEHLTPVTLELGGKSPVIIDRSANLELAAKRIAWGKFFNAGQTCVAPDYILVDEVVEDEFLRKLASTLRSFYGDNPQSSPDYSRIVSPRHHKRLVELLEQSDGELVVGGGYDAEDRYIAPTVLRNVDSQDKLMEDELFGPLLPVLAVKNVREAIDFINSKDHPLALYVFAEDSDVQKMVLEQTQSGGSVVNHVMVHLSVPSLPFGGVGESGMGNYHGKWGFDAFSHKRAVLEVSTRVDSTALLYPPASKLKDKIVRTVL